jgi:RNA polymerase sigma factor (sigma-70 family)
MQDLENKFETRYSLINCVRNRSDHEAWKDFVDFYDQYIYSVLRRYEISSDDSEEVCIKIVQRLWEDVPKYDGGNNQMRFRDWLGDIITSQISLYYRTQPDKFEKINKRISDSKISKSEEDSFSAIIENEWKIHVSNKAWEAIQDCLKDNAKKVFLMSINGHSAEQIAKECGVAQDSICFFENRVRGLLVEECSKQNEKYHNMVAHKV